MTQTPREDAEAYAYRVRWVAADEEPKPSASHCCAVRFSSPTGGRQNHSSVKTFHQ